jgi:hypothetical protein
MNAGGILNLTRQSLLASLPLNDAEAFASFAPPSPPLGKLKLRNEEINPAGLDKLLRAPAKLLTVPAIPPNLLVIALVAAVLIALVAATCNNDVINFPFYTLFS